MNTMNDDDNNPQPQPWIDPALEARVVALVLGETSAFEAAELERIVTEIPELAIFKRRIEAVHALVGTALRPENPKIQLSLERRRKLLETIGVPLVVPPKKIRALTLARPAWWSSQLLIRVAACLVMTSLVLAIFSKVNVFRNSAEPPDFEGFSSNSYTGGAVVSSGIVTTITPAPAATPSRQAAVGQVFGQADALATMDAEDGKADGMKLAKEAPQTKRLEKAQSQAQQSDEKIGADKPSESSSQVLLANQPPLPDTQQAGEQVSTIRQFTGRWGKGSGTGGGVKNETVSSTEPSVAAPVAATGPSAEASEDKVVHQDFAKNQEDQSGKTKSAAGWDSLYMYRGVNVLGGQDAETKPLPAEVVEQVVKYLPENQGTVTARDRSASVAVSANSVDALLFGAPAETTADADQKPVKKAQALTPSDTTDIDQSGIAQSNKDSTPMVGDVPLKGRLFRDESNNATSHLVENVINQPVFSSRGGKVEFEGSINYGSPITVAPTAEKKVEQTKHLLAEAQKFSDSGRQDLAFKRYEQTLAVDPHNPEARRGMEQMNLDRSKYAASTIDGSRSDLVRQVDRTWEMPVRRFEAGASTIMTQPQSDTRGTTSINRKLDDITIPRINFRDVTIREAVDFIKQRAAALDTTEVDPARKGINIVLKLPPDAAESNAKLTLTLTDIPLRAAIDSVAKAANLKLKIEPYAVVVVPENEPDGRDGSPNHPTSAVSEKPPYQPNEIQTAKQPVSTFSLHVSDVSFQLAKDALAKGTMPDPARIRPEEFYNAFDYNDPSPAAGEEVACRIEQTAHPFLQQRDLVRIALKVAAAGRAAGQPLRLTILLDTSGSMEREDRAASVRRALQTLATLLGPNDRVTLIGFARTPRLLAEAVPGDQAAKLVEIAASTPSEGGTNLEEALALASEMALKQKLPAAQNRIVLLTDGAANLGNANPARLAKQIEKTRQQGISFDACGVGANGLNDEMLEALTRKGDGRYYFLNKPEDADAGFARQLAGALRPAAENVKVQVVFNPARVSQYRLIGFEKHLLKKEDFRNDKVQAAELSAEEAGVALYQVATLPEGEGELGQVFVRFRDPATGQMVERSWTMPYDAKTPALDQALPSMQLATTAALLAEKLRGDSQVDLNALAPIVNNLRGHYSNQARVAELIKMFEQMRR